MKIVSQAGSNKPIGWARRRQGLRPTTGGLLLMSALLVAALAGGCTKDEAPPPLPQAKPATTPTALQLEIPKDEDAGATKPVKKGGKGGGGAAGALGPCCAALKQNAASAPPETQAHMLNAAAACDAANKVGGSKSSFLGLLRGAGLPAACQ
jgi:hypothetical protein